jgi:hypothetical protein
MVHVAILFMFRKTISMAYTITMLGNAKISLSYRLVYNLLTLSMQGYVGKGAANMFSVSEPCNSGDWQMVFD